MVFKTPAVETCRLAHEVKTVVTVMLMVDSTAVVILARIPDQTGYGISAMAHIAADHMDYCPVDQSISALADTGRLLIHADRDAIVGVHAWSNQRYQPEFAPGCSGFF